MAFVDFFEPYARVIAFVLQHGSERASARIQHRLGALDLGLGGSVPVANEDGAVLSHQRRGSLVQKVFSAVFDFGMQRPYALRLVGPLGLA